MKTRISITLSEEVYNDFREYCQANGMKVSSKIEVLVKELLEDINQRSALLKENHPEKGKT